MFFNVVHLVIKPLLVDAYRKGNQGNIIKHVHCHDIHGSFNCKCPAATCGPVSCSVDHLVANATMGATKVAHPPVSAKTDSGNMHASESDSDFEPASNCSSELDSTYDYVWDAQQEQAVDREAVPSATIK